ncbi:MAG: hypothetical protein ACRYFS_22355 [Janthinobacterium lividum]
MRTLSEKHHRQIQQQRASLEKMRWAYTFVFSFDAILNAVTVFDKRSQLPYLFTPLSSMGLPVWHHIWINIFNVAIGPTLVALWWMRFHAYRRDQLAAEQEALRMTSKPTEGIWPPPPQQSV